MAADRQRLAAALAYEEERRRRMMESVPTTDNLPPVQPTRRSLRTDLENLSSGIGQGVVNQLEGVKALVTDPVGTARATYEGVKGIVRDPSVLADALRYTAQKATSGPLGAGEVIGEMVSPMRGKPPVMQEIDVYHGSPHRFEEFDASKIGTGEGAQAYGHGIYLAESPDVAKTYQSAQSPSARKATMTLQASDGNVNKAIAAMKKEVATMTAHKDSPYLRQGAFQETQDALNYLQQMKKGAAPQTGALYTADLPDEMVDRMLRFEMPLSEMPDDVAKLINPIREQLAKQPNPHLFANLKTVGDIIQYSNAVGLKPHERLQKAGIPGIKYLDAGSRGQGGSGTRNFVVFPGEEKKVKILKRD
jgi:hypothetical protein